MGSLKCSVGFLTSALKMARVRVSPTASGTTEAKRSIGIGSPRGSVVEVGATGAGMGWMGCNPLVVKVRGIGIPL